MRLFLRVAELESFTRAAQALGLPKGSVSRQIQVLENRLGTQLLYRTTRQVRLTHDGLIYYERSRDILANLDELDGLFLNNTASVSGHLRVDMPVNIAKYLVIPMLPEFLHRYPGITLELSSSDRLVDVVGEGFDCVIRAGQLKDPTLIARQVGKLSMVNCASQNYLARFGYPETLDDLANHAVVHFASTPGGNPQGFEVWQDETTHWIKTGGVITVNSTESYLAACIAGLGIIQVPRVGVKSYLKKRTLTDILPQYRAQPMPVTLFYPHRRNLSRRVYLFMEWLIDIIKGYVD